MASIWAVEKAVCDDEDCIIIDQEDSTSSYDAFFWNDPSSRSSMTESRSEISRKYNAAKRAIVSGSDLETPKIKSSSFSLSHQSARRKLVFTVSADDDKDVDSVPSCSIKSKTSEGTNPIAQYNPSSLPEISILEDTVQNVNARDDCKSLNKGEEKTSVVQTTVQQKKEVRKVAQLVVWTKNIGKGLNNSDKEVLAPVTAIPSTTAPAPESLDNLENNLFYVQCPVRSAAAPSKKEKIPNKRIKKDPTKNKKKSSRKNRAAAQAGSSAGRAYRAYLHTCLEKQRQQLTTGDFKVEKLFQPEQGVALPGEIIPPIEISSCIPLADTAPIADISYKSIPPLSSSSEVIDAETAQNLPKPTGDDNKISVINNPEGDFAVFDLPDRFTVTTDTANAFDLLIQNVVHEELIDGEDDDELMGYKFDRVRKRMRMSTGSNSSEERMSMDETGKPRCTYTELIEKALTESGGLTVSEIYTWISDRYPFYKPDDDRWKNSVRHNLSINPYFKKGEKARSGAGHLWTISEESKGLRSSLINFDERRRSPSDPSEIIMPMDSETDRAVANILGQYLSECRANKEASEKEKGSRNTQSVATLAAAPEPATETSAISLSSQQQQPPLCIGDGAICDMAPIEDVTSFNLNELNSGQFTVDLAGITIPDGGSINFEELVNAGRLIFIQTDSDANKENDSTQAVIVNECMLSDLSTLDCNTATTTQDEGRFNAFYNDSLALELGFEKNDTVPNVSFANEIPHLSYATSAFSTGSSGNCADILNCGQLAQGDVGGEHHHHDLTVLDQVIPMSYEEVVSVNINNESQMTSGTLGVINAAALYESKELGISYTFQTGGNNHDLL